jgi:hypothetical protein
MTFAHAVDRVQTEFIEMPDLELTMPQAVRLWHLGADDCRYVIDALVDAGFLTWTPQRTIVRIGRGLRLTTSQQSHVRVRSTRNTDKNVGRE